MENVTAFVITSSLAELRKIPEQRLGPELLPNLHRNGAPCRDK